MTGGLAGGMRRAAGVGGILILWELVGRSGVGGESLPPLSAILTYLLDPKHAGLLTRAALATLRSAALGYAIGAVLGGGLAALTSVYPELRRGADRLSAWIHAVPAIALGSIFVILLGIGPAQVAMAAMAVIFYFYVALTSGFGLTTPAHADLMTVLGAPPGQRFLRLTLPAAMPAIATGMKLAVPRAFLGAVMGEWFGASRGLGVLMVTGMQEARIPLLWSSTLLVTLLCMIFFLLANRLEARLVGRFG